MKTVYNLICHIYYPGNEIILIFAAFVSLTAVFIALVILFVKKMFGSKLSPFFHCFIWIVFVLRLIFPFTPESSISVYNIAVGIYKNAIEIRHSSIETYHTDTTPLSLLPSESIESSEQKLPQTSEIYHFSNDAQKAGVISTTGSDVPADNNNGNDTQNIQNNKISVNIFTRKNMTIFLFALYFIVLTGCIFAYYKKYSRYKRRILKSCTPASQDEKILLERMKNVLNINKNIKLLKGKESVLIGVFSPVIVLSDSGDISTENSKTAVITHELLHYKHKDNLINIILSIVKYIYWFNPLIHYFMRKIKNDMELLCDIKSINILNLRKEEYAIMLFKSSDKNNKSEIPAGAANMSAKGNQLIYRLNFISAFKKPRRTASIIASVIVTVLLLTSLTNPSAAFKYTPDDPRIKVTITDSEIYESMDYEFIPDDNAVGEWEVVDYVRNISDFQPDVQQCTLVPLFWLNISFSDNGNMMTQFDEGVSVKEVRELTGDIRISTGKWTNGLILLYGTIPEYTIKDIDGEQYMFIQWKSGDYTIHGMKPQYYVFKKTSDITEAVTTSEDNISSDIQDETVTTQIGNLIITTPKGYEPIQNDNGTITLPLSGTYTILSGDKIIVSSGTVIRNDGVVPGAPIDKGKRLTGNFLNSGKKITIERVNGDIITIDEYGAILINGKNLTEMDNALEILNILGNYLSYNGYSIIGDHFIDDSGFDYESDWERFKENIDLPDDYTFSGDWYGPGVLLNQYGAISSSDYIIQGIPDEWEMGTWNGFFRSGTVFNGKQTIIVLYNGTKISGTNNAFQEVIKVGFDSGTISISGNSTIELPNGIIINAPINTTVSGSETDNTLTITIGDGEATITQSDGTSYAISAGTILDGEGNVK